MAIFANVLRADTIVIIIYTCKKGFIILQTKVKGKTKNTSEDTHRFPGKFIWILNPHHTNLML